MKNFLLVTLVIGICIRNSIGKEKLKIDLPENFQADFMKTFARVMRSDYPNCDINPEEVLFKIGVEFLKRAGESGLDINLEDNSRSKRAIDPTRNDDEPTPAETNERQKRFIGLGKLVAKVKSKIGHAKLVAKVKSKIGHAKLATKVKSKIVNAKLVTKVKSKIVNAKLATKVKSKIVNAKLATKVKSKIGLEEALAAKLNVGQLGAISEDLSQERRRRGTKTLKSRIKDQGVLPKLSKVAKLLAPAGAGGAYGKRSIDDNLWTPQDEAVAERSIETDDAEIDQNRHVNEAFENDDEPTPAETNERQKRFISTKYHKTKIGLGKLAAKVKSKIGFGKLVTKLKKKIGHAKLATKLKSKIGLEEALAAKLNVGQLGAISEDLSQERRRRGIFKAFKATSKVAAGAGGHGKRSIDDNVWTPQDEAVAERSIETDDAEIDQNREQRSAYEMLMDSVDEVNVKRNADFDQEIAKRKRRNALDLLMDTAQSRNMEF